MGQTGWQGRCVEQRDGIRMSGVARRSLLGVVKGGWMTLDEAGWSYIVDCVSDGGVIVRARGMLQGRQRVFHSSMRDSAQGSSGRG